APGGDGATRGGGGGGRGAGGHGPGGPPGGCREGAGGSVPERRGSRGRSLHSPTLALRGRQGRGAHRRPGGAPTHGGASYHAGLEMRMPVSMHCRYFPPEVGGLESAVFHLCRGLAGRGRRVGFVTSRSRAESPRHEVIDGVEVWRTWFPSRSPVGWVG